MGAMEPANPALERDFAEFDHWVYAVVPGIGYTMKAFSRGFNVGLYDPYLRGHYTPIRAATAQAIDGDVDLRMAHPIPNGREFLLSRITRGSPDEAGRPTFTNHTLVLRMDLLRSGRIRLEESFQAMGEFDERTPDAQGEQDLLRVPLHGEGDGLARLGEGIHKHLTYPALETLATRVMANHTNRTLLLCRNTTSEARNTTLVLLLELLGLKCGLPLFTAISDTPRSSALNYFNLVIAQRGVRADSTWAILESALVEPVLPRMLDREDVYQALRAASRQSAGIARAV